MITSTPKDSNQTTEATVTIPIQKIVQIGLEMGKTADIFSALRITSKIDPANTFKAAIGLIESSNLEQGSNIQEESLRIILRLAEPKNFKRVCAAIAPLLKEEKTSEIFKKVFKEERKDIENDLVSKINLFIKNPRLVELQLAAKGIESSRIHPTSR